MINLEFEYKNALNFVEKKDILKFQTEINNHFESLNNKSGKGNDFLGWMDIPDGISEELIADVESVANTLRSKSDIAVVVGIGGSYLGSRAIIDALSHHFNHLKSGNNPVVVYAGQNISEDYLTDLMDVLNDRDYTLIVISKSGTTTEPAVAFRL